MTLIAIDIETNCIHPWQEGARICGLGVCWGFDFDKQTKYYIDPVEIEQKLRSIAEKKLPVIFFNNMFECKWFRYFYPDLELNIIGDAYALMFFLKNNNPTKDLKSWVQQLFKIMPYEDELKNHILATNEDAKPSEWKNFIHTAPVDLVSKYCRYDAFYTYMLWSEYYDKVNTSVLMPIYLAEVDMQVEALLHGIPVDVELLHENLKKVTDKIEASKQAFLKDPMIELAVKDVILERYVAYAQKLKGPATYDKWAARKQGNTGLLNGQFNTGSADQLAQVFSKLGFGTPQKPWPIWTDGGEKGDKKKPSFKADDLWRYGDHGKLLYDAMARKKAKEKLESILSETQNGMLRSEVRILGTDTIRVSGSETNLPALQFGDPDVGSCLIAPEGKLIFSMDVQALEPTLIALITEDEGLLYATCTGIGKLPRFDGNYLIVDDVYLQVMSRFGEYTNLLKTKFKPDQWLADPEAVKKLFKEERFAFKVMTLAYIYGSGVDTLSNVMYKNTGKSYEEKFIRDMCFAVKQAFPKMFSKRIYFNSVARQTGKLQNPFGLILRFDNSTAHVAFNHLIQSTGACVMKLFIYFMLKRIQDIPWITPIIPNIHDASFSQIDEDRIDDATKLYQECLGDVNDLLIKNYGFKYPLRISFSSGKNFYDVKG